MVVICILCFSTSVKNGSGLLKSSTSVNYQSFTQKIWKKIWLSFSKSSSDS